MAIGAKIKEFRLKKGMTQRELAERLNISMQAVSKWERGGTPDIFMIIPLAKILDVTPNQLLEYEEEIK